MLKLASWTGRHRALVSVTVVGVLVALGFTALHALTATLHVADIRTAFHAIAPSQLALALGCTAISYLALTFYDVLALRVIGRPLPWRTAALASFVSYTISHNLGLSLITGGSARYRIYSRAGLDAADVGRVVAIAGSTFWMGVLAVTGMALTIHGGTLKIAGLTLSPLLTHGIGGAIIAATAALIALCAFGPGRLRLGRWTLPLPDAKTATAQIGIAGIDLAAAGAALFLLIPGADPALLPSFILAYGLGIIATVITHVPGGIGVFEAVVIATVPADKPALAAALIAYRVIYYLLPLGLGVAALAIREGRDRRVAQTFAGIRKVTTGLAPMLLSAAAFVGGGILLLSGSTPGVPERLQTLHAIVPLPFIEASHLAASLVGTGLLLLAPGLYRRLDGAFVAARALLIAGAIFSLVKGIDYEEAVVCLTIAGLLQWTRPAFYRTTALTAQPFSPSWLASVAAVSGLAIWVGLFSYKHVDYQHALWWDFALRDDVSRYLRASLGVAIVLSATAMWRLFGPASQHEQAAMPPADIMPALALADRTDAMLALTGDKRFLMAKGGDAFLMYQVKGSSWIVMADPVGRREAWRDLLWTIRGMADAAQGRLMLYQVSSDMLALAIELGLQIVKYGEEAIIDLTGFSLDGPKMRSLRQAERRAVREGAQFEVIPAEGVEALLPELAAISDEWLDAKSQREKAFSLGRFDPAYITRFDCAIIRFEGRIVAFANLWKTANRRELSVDLMRHGEGSPPGVMDYLFASLMLWGREQGYTRFSLGLAPLSGIEGRRLAPLWAKAASMLFHHGERFYGFKGLRAYKQKFAPIWEPRYIAAPHGVGLIKAMHDLNRLIGHPGTLPDLMPTYAPDLPMPANDDAVRAA